MVATFEACFLEKGLLRSRCRRCAKCALRSLALNIPTSSKCADADRPRLRARLKTSGHTSDVFIRSKLSKNFTASPSRPQPASSSHSPGKSHRAVCPTSLAASHATLHPLRSVRGRQSCQLGSRLPAFYKRMKPLRVAIFGRPPSGKKRGFPSGKTVKTRPFFSRFVSVVYTPDFGWFGFETLGSRLTKY